MRTIKIISILALFISIQSCKKEAKEAKEEQEQEAASVEEIKSSITGTIIKYVDFQSAFVDPRNVDIWFPPSYDSINTVRYPVIYMHDGQVLFERGRGFSGKEWEVDEMMTNLIKENKVQDAIIVGVWNTGKRFREYQPNKPFVNLSAAQKVLRDSLDAEYKGGPLADEYLKFIVKELKPFIDTTYKTMSDKANTYMMGSSMGGLITIYAMAEYPDVFKSVACLSTHFPVSLKVNESETTHLIIDYLKENLPDGSSNNIYFDYGTETLDAWYPSHQQYMDSALAEIGYVEGENWETRKFKGAEHSEVSWKARLDIPLEFLIGK